MASASVKETPEELLKKGESLKAEGNSAYAEKSYKAAIRLYHKALLYGRAAASPSSAGLMGIPEGSSKTPTKVTGEASQLVATCHNNIAAVILSNPESSKGDYERAQDHCKKVLTSDENNSKALYRLGQAQYLTQDFEKALETLSKALKAGASVAAINKIRQNCNDELKQRSDRQKQEWKGLFDRKQKNPADNVFIPPEILELFSQQKL